MVNGGTRLAFGNTFMYLALGVMIFFAGFRFEIGYDYPKYLAGYLYDSELQHWEPFFNFFVRLIRNYNFGLDVQAMFLFFSSLSILLIYFALRQLTQYYRLGILLYILTPAYYLASFSVVRQGIALGIVLYSVKYIVSKQIDFKKYVITLFIAFMFHYGSFFASMIYIVGYKFFQRLYSWTFYILLTFISFFLSFAHFGKILLLLLPGHFGLYANSEIAIHPLKLLLVNLFFIILLTQKNDFSKSKLATFSLNSMFLGLMVFNVFSDFLYITRLAHYFSLVSIVLVPIYIYSINGIYKRRVVLVLFFMYYLFDYNYALYRDMTYPGNRVNFAIPYKNYFFEETKSHRNLNIEAWYNYIQEHVSEQNSEEIK